LIRCSTGTNTQSAGPAAPPLGAGTATREGERVRGGKGVPVAFYPPDLIACFVPQPPPGMASPTDKHLQRGE
jgi:hypothetical protein